MIPLGIIAASRPAFTPLDYTPQLWLQAKDLATITESSGAVSQWNDKSGFSRHASQGTGVAQPLTGTSNYNGHNTLKFDGTNDYLVTASNAIGRNVTGITIYALSKRVSGAGSLVNVTTTSIGNTRADLLQNFGGNKTSARARSSDVGGLSSAVGSTDTPSAFALYTAVFDYANTDSFLYLDGVLDATQSSFHSGPTADTNSAGTVIGANGALYLGCELAELFIFHGSHDSTQRANMEAYFASEWS